MLMLLVLLVFIYLHNNKFVCLIIKYTHEGVIMLTLMLMLLDMRGFFLLLIE